MNETYSRRVRALSIRRRTAGFTLVEMALTVGLLATAFIPLIALLPSGMHNFRRAMNLSIVTQIAQRVLGDAQQADFDLLVDRARLRGRRLEPGFTFRAPSETAPAL